MTQGVYSSWRSGSEPEPPALRSPQTSCLTQSLAVTEVTNCTFNWCSCLRWSCDFMSCCWIRSWAGVGCERPRRVSDDRMYKLNSFQVQVTLLVDCVGSRVTITHSTGNSCRRKRKFRKCVGIKVWRWQKVMTKGRKGGSEEGVYAVDSERQIKRVRWSCERRYLGNDSLLAHRRRLHDF